MLDVFLVRVERYPVNDGVRKGAFAVAYLVVPVLTSFSHCSLLMYSKSIDWPGCASHCSVFMVVCGVNTLDCWLKVCRNTQYIGNFGDELSLFQAISSCFFSCLMVFFKKIKDGESMKVKNLIGSSDNTCFCGSWLEHWKIYNEGGRKNKLRCSAKDCNGLAEVGAHVIKYNTNDRSRYIVPLCKACNCRSDVFDIGDTPLASANVAATCGE